MAKIKAARVHIEEAIKAATNKTARFGFADPAFDLMIKKETHLHRDSWIISPLIEALTALDPCKAKGCTSGRIYSGVNFASMNCPACKGFGIDGGLSFNPWDMSREAITTGDEV